MTWFYHVPSNLYFPSYNIVGIQVAYSKHDKYHAVVMLASGDIVLVLTGRNTAAELAQAIENDMLTPIQNNTPLVTLNS